MGEEERRARRARRMMATLAATLALALTAVLPYPLPAQQGVPGTRVLDDFETVSGWSPHPADGVALAIRSGAGRRGRAMRLDFDFHGHGGYAIAHKAFAIDLPENYEFTFWLRAEAPVNNLEFKLIDATGDNVWWDNQRDFHFPREWTKVTIKRRHITFAWGPVGGGVPKHVASIEIVVTAGNGGAGSVWIDDLAFTPLEPVRPYTLTPHIVASSSAPGHDAARVLDADSTTEWRSTSRPDTQSLTLDFLRRREYGGVVIDWAPGDHASNYALETSDDGVQWTLVRAVVGGNGGRDDVDIHEAESRYLRLRLERSARGRGGGYAIRTLVVKPVEWSETANDFFRNVARDEPAGSFPRYLAGEQSYWTVVGVSGDTANALINEDGMIESGRGAFSVEPFLFADGRLVTWHDAARQQTLARGDLPIPSVSWDVDSLRLTVTAVAAGRPGAATLFARYRVANRGARTARTTLYLTLRPFQVNPSWQFLNTPGGVAPIRRLAVMRAAAGGTGKAAGRAGNAGDAPAHRAIDRPRRTAQHADTTVASGSLVVQVNDRRVISITRPAAFGATTFDQGMIVEALRRDTLPAHSGVVDSTGRASGAFAYPLVLPPRASRDIWLAIPLSGSGVPGELSPAGAERALQETERAWAARLDRVSIELPGAASDIAATLRTTLAYILINRRGPALRPGTRAYARSWIRDGALMSAALLPLGATDAVREYIAWYAPYQYRSGRVPCCVDARGADPVPENDSDGELIYLIAEYYRYTGDRALVEREWPHIVHAMQHIDSLRHARMTADYQAPERRAFFGLLPQSISHEGYSAKPMHSYWDDFFALRGAKDATALAAALGRESDRVRFSVTRDELERDIMASLRLAMANHRIDYLPGSVELGDFDATSTTIAIAPGGELAALPQNALHRTFERYWEAFRARRDGTASWDAYTPYELRTVGTFVRLGQPERAHELLRYFLADRRPSAWHAWAEVVWRDPRAPKFIGDMPHAWVGSDFIRSTLDMLAYTRAADSALVIGAGIPATWVTTAPGVTVRGLRTYDGPLSFIMRADTGAHEVHVRIGGLTRVPPGGIVVRSPLPAPIRGMVLDGAAMPVASPSEVVLRRLPAVLTLRY